jgi:type I restriction enzyme, S subunit
MRAWQGAVGVSEYRGIVSPAYVVMRPRGHSNSRYFHQLYRTPQFAKEAERWSYGITSDMWSLRPEHFKIIYSALPPREEQDAIVRFLENANRRIGRYIRTKQKLIKLLEEEKQVVIHRAVTSGLDPKFRLKPSGVEWLGDLPGHWQTTKLARLTTRIGDGLHGTPEYVDESPYHFINGNNLSSGFIKLSLSTRCVGSDQFKKYKIELNDKTLLMSINGTIGSVAYYQGESIILGKSAAYINCGEALSRSFLFYYLQSIAVRNFFRREVTGTTIFNLSLATIRNLSVGLPPLAEQLEISSFLDLRMAEFDDLIGKATREISLFREYRTRLIADVVTGKLDVRGVELPALAEEEVVEDPDEVDETETDEVAELIVEPTHADN